ncbi:MAG: peptidoglycan-binding domain-containing protein [Planctomycetota bacterium]
MSSIGIGGSSPMVRPVSGLGVDSASSAASTEAAGLSSQVFAGNTTIQSEAASGQIRMGARGNNVRAIQVGLAKLGFLSGSLDGIMGRGTTNALATFQRAQGLVPDGICGPKTLAALDAALGAQPSGGEAMANAAQGLVDKYAQNYGVEDAWLNLDTNHALPANVQLGGLKGKWKCNLFAGNTMAAAGFEPPYYNNRGGGEYPNANQLFKWSDKYAGKYGNKGHEAFEMRGELKPGDLSGAERDQAIKDLLATAEPGDMIIVDHMGTDVADGGHCRVVVSNNIANDGTIDCAQASSNEALVRGERVSSFTGEEHIWILRATTKRREGPAPM